MMRPLLLTLCLLVSASCDQSKKASDGSAPAASADAKKKAPADDKGVDAKAKAPDETSTNVKAPPAASVKVGEPAPDFTLTDIDGNEHTLSAHKGKTVVLEWFNPQCPFVQYSHSEGPLAKMAAAEMAQGVVWLSINSGAPGKQGHGAEANRAGIEEYGMTNPVLLDEDGTVGHMYGAEKTPHMYVIDPEGTLVYRGAIDNAPIGEVDGGGEKVNYVQAALAELREGKPVSEAETPAYGCTVKYAKG